jgi:peptidoglycan lytic transglycosylase
MRSIRPLLILALATVFVACSSSRKGGYYENDGPPDKKVDLSSIPDAVPHSEPLSKTGNKPYDVFGKHYVPMTSASGFRQKGVASWYGKQFHGRRTSSGEPYDMYAMTAAHTVLPLPSYVRVTNVANGRTVVVKVNDRGPFKSSRVMDLSYAAASRLDMIRNGTALVEIVAIGENTPQQQTAEPPATETTWHQLYIQLGAFSNPATARDLRQQLLDEGYRDVAVTVIDLGSKRLHRVRLGPLESSQQGDVLLGMLRDAGHTQAKIVTD